VLVFLHLQNSLVGLTLVYITFQLPFSLFVTRNAFAEIPQVTILPCLVIFLVLQRYYVRGLTGAVR
jgi:ABC-type glycerol-3-phosphate transport system permease component